LGVFSLLGICGHVSAGVLRIVDWNIEDDINGATTPLPGLNTVLQGIGNEILAGDAQPLDIMTLEETTSNSTTVSPIVTDLNNDYGAGTYAMSSYQATESGNDPTDGNGPNALVYNTKTVTLLNSVGIGTPGGSSNGEYRQVVRYEFEPVGTTSVFYIYVSHMKSGSTSSDATDRGKEAAIITADEATLPVNSSVMIMGDLNADPTESGETQFGVFTAGGNSDPAGYSTSVQYWSESATDLRYRDDYQLMTSNVLNDTGPIDYVSGTLNYLGNNGTTASGKSVNLGTNAALNYMNGGLYGTGNYPTQSQVLSALTTASDHLPNIADYTFVSVPEPACLALLASGASALLIRRRPRR
jgi:hypothetical protein